MIPLKFPNGNRAGLDYPLRVASGYDHISTAEPVAATAARGPSTSPEKFELAFHACPDPILITRQHDGKIIEANEAFERIYGVPVAQALGLTTVELGIWPNVAVRNRMVDLLKAEGRLRNYPCEVSIRGGTQRTGLVSAEPIMVDGEACLVVIFHDITEEKRMERSFQESEERYRNFIALSAEGIVRLDFDQPVPVSLPVTEQVEVMIRTAFVGECNDAAARMRGWSKASELEGRRVMDLEQTGDPTTWLNINSFVSSGFRIVDAVTLGRDVNGSDAYFLNNAVGVIQDGCVRHVWVVQRNITERVLGEQALRESEERFHNLAAAAFEGIGIVEDGRIVEVNDQLAQMLGCKREQLIGSPVIDCVAPESREFVAAMVAAGNPGPYEHLALRSDGTTFPVEVQARNFSSGRRQLRVTSVRDITARKAAEESLRASEERLRATVENTPHVAVQWFDSQGRVLFWNPASEDMYGWPAAEAMGKTLDQLIQTPEHAAEFLKVLREIDRTGNSSGPIEYHFRRRNGQEGTSLSTTFRIPTGAGESCFVCMDVDITEQKRAAEALRASEERFELAVRASNEGIWDWNVGTNEVYHSPRVRELLGYGPDEFPDFLESFDMVLHPEDRDRIWKAIGEHLEHRVPYNVQFRAKTKSGEHRWFQSRGQAVWDDTGRAVRMAGSLADIHEHKLAEESLRRAQAEALVAQEKFTQRLISAQEKERKRLANELHDSLGQNLSLIKNRAYLAAEQPGVPPDAALHIEAIGKVATDAIAEVRNLAQNLRPLHIEQFGLTDSLHSLLEQTQPTTPIHLERRLENVDDLYRGEEATILYRIVQEAVNNLVKHAQATRAMVSVERDLHCVRLCIEDDGRGFDLQVITAARRTRTGIGLTSIGERARMLGGTLQIESAPGRGTKIKIELPLATPPPPSDGS